MSTSQAESTELWWHRRTWLVIVAVAIVFALADAAQTSFILRALGRPPHWRLMALRDLTFWLTFVALMPAVLFLADCYVHDAWHRSGRKADDVNSNLGETVS